MHREVADSQERLVLAVDAERSRIERQLHEGVQQRLVALAVGVQLARESGADPQVLDGLERDVQQALQDSATLAQRLYPTLLEVGGLAPALRAAAVSSGTSATVQVVAASGYPTHFARTIYWCWLDLLDAAGPSGRATISVRLDDDALTFEASSSAVGELDARLDALHTRVRALGGVLTVESDAGGATHVHGSLPLA